MKITLLKWKLDLLEKIFVTWRRDSRVEITLLKYKLN